MDVGDLLGVDLTTLLIDNKSEEHYFSAEEVTFVLVDDQVCFCQSAYHLLNVA